MNTSKVGRKSKPANQKKVQVIFYVPQMFSEEFRQKVAPIAEKINKRKMN